MEPKIRHLELIQRAITGASDNSLRIKGFAMLLFAGTIAFLLRGDESVPAISLPLAIVLLVTIFILWLLDFYFGRQADLFKFLYNEVRTLPEVDIDFSMNAEQHTVELDYRYSNSPPIPVVATGVFYTCASLTVIFAALP